MKTKISFFTTIFILFLCFNSFTCATQTLPMFIKQDRDTKQILLGTSAWLFYTFKKNKDPIDIALCNMLTISLACSLILSLYVKNGELHAKDNEIKKQKDANTSYNDMSDKIINDLTQFNTSQDTRISQLERINAMLNESIESKKKTIEELENTNRWKNDTINELNKSIALQPNSIDVLNDTNALLKNFYKTNNETISQLEQSIELKDKMIDEMEEQNKLLKKRLENCLAPILL